MEKRKLTFEELKKRKMEMAAEDGTYVVRGLSIESRALIRLLNGYDWSLSFIKRNMGRQGITHDRAIDALSLIERCVKFEDEFKSLTNDLTKFARGSIKEYKGNNNGQQTENNNSGHLVDNADEPKKPVSSAQKTKKQHAAVDVA